MSSARNKFVRLLPSGGKILDLGCGSGRDSLAFMKMGFDVVPVDGSEGMCHEAEKNTGLKVRRLLFEDLDYENEFDGVWACSSLLHLRSVRIPTVLGLIRRSLRQDGIFFTCFKKGDFEDLRPDGRYYTDMEYDVFRSVLLSSGFEPLEIWESDGSAGETWLNSINSAEKPHKTIENRSKSR